jgi:HAD superfamily hydrolase (TIGR01509 family)
MPASRNRDDAQPIAAVIFDLDGLLVDSETASSEAMRRFLAGHGHAMVPKTLAGAVGRRLPEAVAYVVESYGLPGPVEAYVAEYDALRLDAQRGTVVAMPGAMDFVRWVRSAGLLSALATSSYRRHANVSLAEAGLTGLFDVEVTGDEVRFGKPAPELFFLAAERLAVAPEACVVFEDAPAGLEAAASAGMRRVWVPNQHTRGLTSPVPVDAVLGSLAEAPDWLRLQPMWPLRQRR